MRRVYSTITVAAGVTSAVTSVSTPDDNNAKTLKSIFVSPPTANVQVYVLRAGFQHQYFDASRCGVGNWPLWIDEQYDALIQFQYQVVNGTAASVTLFVTWEYVPGREPGSRPPPPVVAM